MEPKHQILLAAEMSDLVSRQGGDMGGIGWEERKKKDAVSLSALTGVRVIIQTYPAE